MASRRILHFGLAGPVTDQQVKSGMTADGVQAQVNEGAQKARDAGYEVQTTFFEAADFDTALSDLKRELETGKWDALAIGGGIRMTVSLTPQFEQALNTAREVAPQTKLLFQMAPGDLHETIRRGLEGDGK